MRRWTALWDGQEAPWSMALLRLLLGTAVFVDIALLASQGLVEAVMVSSDHGGIVQPLDDRMVTVAWWSLFGDSASSAWGLWAGLMLTSLGLATGTFARASALGWVVLSAQFALIHPDGDRGIDTMVRNVALILACSGAGEAFSVDARWRTGSWVGDGRPVSRWPRRLVLLQLVVMYFAAGVSKYAQHWWPWGGFEALWVIWQDWAVSRVAAQAWVQTWWAYRFAQLATAVTIGWEITFPIMIWLWARLETPGRHGWVRRLRPDLVYVALGAVFHLGIGVWLELGVFPWAMLALYPSFLRPDELAALMSAIRRTDLSIVAKALRREAPELA